MYLQIPLPALEVTQTHLREAIDTFPWRSHMVCFGFCVNGNVIASSNHFVVHRYRRDRKE